MIGLWCYIEGKTDCFIVFISPDSYISELKEQIYIKGSNSFVGCDFMDLNLIKVNVEICALNEKIYRDGRYEPDANGDRRQLWAREKILEVWPEPPSRDYLQVFVSLPVGLGSATIVDAVVPGKGIFTLPESTFPINRIEDEINQELDSIRGVVKAFLNNPEPTTWISPDSIKITQSNRKFIGDLQIPSYRDGAPSLLFHNLDECDDEEIEMIFGSDGRHTLICNTSGSGKTRRMLEGLTKYWGFYFVATPGSNGVGVRDLRGALDDVAQYPEWAPDLKPFKSEERAAQHKINCCIASLHLRRVLAARIVIFELFLQLAMEVDGTLQEKHKRIWLLLQLSDDLDPSRRLASFRSDHDVSYPRLKSSS